MNRNTQRSLVEAASRVLKEDIDSFVFSHDDDEGNFIRTPGTPINPPGYGIHAGSYGSGGIGALAKGNRLNPGSHDTADHQSSNQPWGGWILDRGDGRRYWWNWNSATGKYERDPNSQGTEGNSKRNPGQWYADDGRWEYRTTNGIRYRIWVPTWVQQPRGPHPIGTIRNNDEYSTVDWYNPLSWPNRFRDDIIW